MNNAQFSKLVNEDGAKVPSRTNGPMATPALGSRARPSVSMTPRAISRSQNDLFAQQVAERRAQTGSNGKNRARGSVPKGVKLPQGYQDRTLLRNSTEDDETAQKVQALETELRSGKINQAAFESLRDELVGGEVKNVHLVKGLDYRLLERIRRGEDVMAEPVVEEAAPDEAEVEDELDAFENQDVVPQERQEIEKRGVMAPPPPPPSAQQQKRTRDEILKALKASREKESKMPELSSRFRRITRDKLPPSRIERDSQGREVLITVGEDGRVKRKVRRSTDPALLQPDKGAIPLGHDVAIPVVSVAEDVKLEEEDIFEGVGTDFDPLGSAADESEPEERAPDSTTDANTEPAARRDYFANSGVAESTEQAPSTMSMNDPTILAALKKAATIAAKTSADWEDEADDSSEQKRREDAERKARHQRMLAGDNRDTADLDLGFGGSRMDDGEDEDEGKSGKRTKLSTWTGLGDAQQDDKGKRDRAKKRKK